MSDNESNSPIAAAPELGDKDMLEQQLKEQLDHLESLQQRFGADQLTQARAQLDIAETLAGLERGEEAWSLARGAFDLFLNEEQWQDAVEACDILYQCDQPASIAALGMGVWLAVTYPIKMQTSYVMLEHIVDETPDKADGGAVAAMVAHYIADVRAEDDKKRANMQFLTINLLARVAKRHSDVSDQAGLDFWIEKLELNNQEKLFSRFALIINAIVEDQWWFDRDELRNKIPQ
ncbi:MAG: hypothetical protein OEY36_13250 [Gammaproteobacteria bacterium]|nr:hypothetical protein [Gammaproteobacteria bacterium]